jgi:ABC-2 type transport system ATP-binding protein
VTSLSRGMTQRLGLARVLLHDPQVLLLDEPASGLDPRARIEIRGLLKELRKMGKTILVSSHILPELADICNKIGIIEQGELVVNGDVSQVMKQVRQNVVLRIGVDQPEKAGALLEAHQHVDSVDVQDGQLLVTLQDKVLDYSFIPTLLVENGHRISMFKEDEINLETAFMELTRGITN